MNNINKVILIIFMVVILIIPVILYFNNNTDSSDDQTDSSEKVDELSNKVDELSNKVDELNKNIDDINEIVNTSEKSVSVNTLRINSKSDDEENAVMVYEGDLTIYQKDKDGDRHYNKLINGNLKKELPNYNPNEFGYWYYSGKL